MPLVQGDTGDRKVYAYLVPVSEFMWGRLFKLTYWFDMQKSQFDVNVWSNQWNCLLQDLNL